MFASSAAHVAGKPLVSSETATWLDEHFNETLGEVKEMVDRLFLAGVNHVIYHGTAYSPADAAWPGWLFYASTQLNPQNPIWRDFPALNEYVTRCQSVLQSTRPDNDILLYWPIHDFWHDPQRPAQGHPRPQQPRMAGRHDFGRTAKWLDEHGYTFDYISDRQLAKCRVVNGENSNGRRRKLCHAAGTRDAIPADRNSCEICSSLAEEGATVVSHGQGPGGTPGWKHRDEQAEFDATRRAIHRIACRMRTATPVPHSDREES